MSIFMKKKKKRFMAIAIVLMMLMSMVPEIRFANAEDATAPAFTVTVKSGDTSISGAIVKYKVEVTENVVDNNGASTQQTSDFLGEKTETTDSNGKANLSELADKLSSLDNAKTYKLFIAVTKTGYYDGVYESQITSTSTSADVNLTKAYTVTASSGGEEVSEAIVTYAVYTKAADTENKTYLGQGFSTSTNEDGVATLQGLKDFESNIASGALVEVTVKKTDYYDATQTDIAFSSTKLNQDIELTSSVVKLDVQPIGETDLRNAVITVGGNPDINKLPKEGDSKFKINSDDDYIITSVLINNVEKLSQAERDVGIKTFEKVFSASEKTSDVTVQIKLETAHTVTVNIDGNGDVTTIPSCAAGSVVAIKNGAAFKITADPDDHYRVSRVTKTVNGNTTILVGQNTTVNNYSLEEYSIGAIKADTAVKVDFAPNNYKVTAQVSGADADCDTFFDGNTNKTSYTGVYGSATTLYIQQSDKRIITAVSIGGTDMLSQIRQDEVNGNLFYLDISDISSDIQVNVVYSAVTIITPDADNPLTATDVYEIVISQMVKSLSNAGKRVYVLHKDGSVKIEAVGEAYEGCALNGETKYTDTIVMINGDALIKTIKLFKEERVFSMVSPLDISIVIDDDIPNTNLTIRNEKEYYAGDVVVDVEAQDSISGVDIGLEEFSGIKSIKYWISVGKGVDTENDAPTGVFDYSTLEQLQTRNETVTIEASKYNYDDVVLTVQTEDFAGNTSKKVIEGINIDATAPQVSLAYDNNNSYNGSQYFNASRTATVVVTEREKSFDKDEAIKNIVITAKDAKGQEVVSAYTISDWTTKVDAENDNLTTHAATIAFTEDANYTLAMNFKDAAGNPNTAITTGNSVAPYAFTVDTTMPEGSVTAKFAEKKEPKVWKSLVKDLTFGYYSTKNIAISGTSTDATSPILSVQYYKQAKTEGGTSLTALTVDALNAVTDWKTFEGFSVTKDEEFVVYLKIMDCAGNYTYISTDGLIVDKTKPVDEVFAPKITADPEQPVNDYYNKDVTISLKIEDPRVNGTCSGINKISYEVYNEAVDSLEPTQEGVLYEYKSGEETKQNWSGKIKVDSSLNNSDDIVVVVRAEDKAGNYDDYTKEIKIDTTTPTVDIKYSNNSAVSDKYFNNARTATIVVTERNFVTKDMKLVITNSDGVAPKVSKWKKTKGTGNGDDTKWTATINYVADGDYTFKLTYQDRAGNKATPKYAEGTVAAKEFTIDQTKPEISVSYNNNDVHNGEYYNQARRATVTVTEHNFDPARVETTIRAEGNGASTPSISSWSTSGDVHTATISYANDGKYTFDISATDLAGNATTDFAEQSFYVDQTVPELEITGIEDQSANAEDVAPIVTYSDSNFDANALDITLTGANRGVVKLDGSYDNSATGGKFTFKNFAKVQDVDDIYTLSATVTDKAGNSVSKEITFSVNRFGSTYEFSEETKEVNERYVQEAQDLVIVETNPTKLSGIKVTLFQNNETILLQEDKDYTLNATGGNGKWYHYTYTIFKEVFAHDGVYKIVIHSEDGAKNVSENIMETKDAELRFGVDKTKPTLVVANLESDKAYDVENLTVIMSANDNLMLAEISVLLDGKELGPWSGASLEKVLDQNGELTFDIPGTSNKSHDVKIICKDAAGNETELEITDFYVTTNGWVLFFNNKPLFYGSILGVLAMIGLIVFIIVKKRKKAEA